MAARQRQGFSLQPLAGTPELLAVFRSVDALLARNPAGAVLQIVRATQAASQEPQLLQATTWAAAGGAALCPDGSAFPQLLFDKWLAVLQQAADRLPFKEDNWQTVLGAVAEGRQKLEAAGLSCGPSAATVQELVAARLAASRIEQAAAAAAAAAAMHGRGQARGQAAAGAPAQQQQQQQQQQQEAAGGSGGRSRCRAAVAAQAAIVAAVEGGAAEEGAEEEEEEAGEGGRQRRSGAQAQAQAQQQQQQAGASPGSDQENQTLPGGQAGSRPGAKRISGLAAAGGKHALQPAQAGEKRQRT